MRSNATISDCGCYRYRLSRHWDAERAPLVFCMLNPSTADATNNDPTITRCIGFARDNGYGGIVVINLFAFRSTDPSALPADLWEAVGPSNAEHIINAIAGLDVVVAWGANQHAKASLTAPTVSLMRTHASRVLCLGVTKSGAPRHPLYVAAAQPLLPYEVAHG